MNSKTMTTYSVAKGEFTDLVSAMILTVIAGSGVFLLYSWWMEDQWWKLLPVIGLAAVTAYTWLFAPTGYALSAQDLIILRKAGDMHLSLASIKSVYEAPEYRRAWRVIGIGGLFGFFGVFYHNGFVTYHASSLTNCVVIETVLDKRIVITPESMQLVRDVQARISN